MSTGKNQHVIPHGKDWGVKGEGNVKCTHILKEKYDAIRVARKISQNQGSELVIHDRKGVIISKESHGGDSFTAGGVSVNKYKPKSLGRVISQ
jgi:hypothetical protein